MSICHGLGKSRGKARARLGLRLPHFGLPVNPNLPYTNAAVTGAIVSRVGMGSLPYRENRTKVLTFGSVSYMVAKVAA
jgi:hypothetical protein